MVPTHTGHLSWAFLIFKEGGLRGIIYPRGTQPWILALVLKEHLNVAVGHAGVLGLTSGSGQQLQYFLAWLQGL